MATEVASPNIAKIHLTERAALKIRALLGKEVVSPDVGGLRVGVQGGGCSGLSYAMRLDTQPRDRVQLFDEHRARLRVELQCVLNLSVLTVAHEETLMRDRCVFHTPTES